MFKLKPAPILTAGDRIKVSLKALRLLKRDKHKPEDLQAIASYCGGGSLFPLFGDNLTKTQQNQLKELRRLLSDREIQSLKDSTPWAFYTPPDIAQYMWDIAKRLGFTRGNILSLSAGTGIFTGLQPRRDRSHWTLIEKDDISAQILEALYPEATLYHTGFESVRLQPNYDLVIDNVPFGDVTLFDPEFEHLGLSIHNHAIAKAVSLLRPGGVAILLTSTGTLDALNGEAFREWLGCRVKLIHAFRLPKEAMASAGTQVTADLLVLQRLPRDQHTHLNNPGTFFFRSETNYQERRRIGGDMPLNEYYVKNPDCILGHLEVCTLYGPRSKRWGVGLRKYDLDELLAERLQWFHKQSWPKAKKDNCIPIPVELLDTPIYSFVLHQGQPFKVLERELEPITSDQYRVVDYIELREALNTLIDMQRRGEETLPYRDALNGWFDHYTDAYGPLEQQTDFQFEPSFPLLLALTDAKGNKAEIFRADTIHAYAPPSQCSTIDDAIVHSQLTRGRLDIAFMATLMDQSYESTAIDLILSGLGFYNPLTHEFESREDYLQGNIIAKLNSLDTPMDGYLAGYMHYNRTALETVKPIPVIPPVAPPQVAAKLDDPLPMREKRAIQTRINAPMIAATHMGIELDQLSAEERTAQLENAMVVRLGATWIPVEVYEQFLLELLLDGAAKSSYDEVTVKYYGHSVTQYEVDVNGNIYRYVSNTDKYGAGGKTADEIFALGLNLKDPVVYRKTLEGKTVMNFEATQACRLALKTIQTAFEDWIWTSETRICQLTAIYNQTFNCFRADVHYDGSHMLFPGSSKDITPRPHQRDGTWRAIRSPNTLLDHEIGGGKTYSLIYAAMEFKRLGIASKPMIAVLNSTLPQFAESAQRLYPHGKFLIANQKSLKKEQRHHFIAQMVLGDWDCIIVPHSVLFRMPMSLEARQRFIQDELGALEEYSGDFGSTSKVVARAKTRLETQIRKATETNRDQIICEWDRIGIDALLLDECQVVKNLFFYTKQRGVLGLNNSASQRSMDTFCKVRTIQARGGRVVFATGTPITNTLGEMFTLQRFLQYDELKRRGINQFDPWSSQFADIVRSPEITHAGRFRMVARLSRFHNLPELIAMFRQFTDIQTQKELQLERPEVETITIDTAPSQAHLDYMDLIGQRVDDIKNKLVKPHEDNNLKLVNEGRLLGVDPRLVTPTTNDLSYQLNLAIANAMHIYDITTPLKATQAIFCDLSTPKRERDLFNVYHYVKDCLNLLGIPAEEIAFVHDAKTEPKRLALFDAVNRGEVRIILGSTEKLGTGVNIQERLIATHDLDCPYRPTDMDQRLGRMVRQGNLFPKTFNFRYVTRGNNDSAGFASFLYQKLEAKSQFIQQVITNGKVIRACEDINEEILSYAQIKAIASGNPLILEKCQVESDLMQLNTAYEIHTGKQFSIRSEIATMEYSLTQRIPQELAEAREKIKNPKLDEHERENIQLTINQLEVMQERYQLRMPDLKKLDGQPFADLDKLNHLRARLTEIDAELQPEEQPEPEKDETKVTYRVEECPTIYRLPSPDLIQEMLESSREPWHDAIADVVNSINGEAIAEVPIPDRSPVDVYRFVKVQLVA